MCGVCGLKKVGIWNTVCVDTCGVSKLYQVLLQYLMWLFYWLLVDWLFGSQSVDWLIGQSVEQSIDWLTIQSDR